MGAQLPEAEAQVPALTLAPAAGEPIARGRGWPRSLDVAIPAGVLVVLLLAFFAWPLIGPVGRPIGGNILNSNIEPFTQGHLFGTDPVGNDIWSRILYGGRSSIEIALAVQLIGLVIGGSFGAFAGYWGGIFDLVLMRVLDVLIAFPALVLALAIAQSLGPSKFHTILALSFFSVPAFARISRAATLRLRERTFILAARLSGTGSPRILARHIAPNILPQLVTFGLLGMGVVIILEGALSFFGLGIPPPNPSWGNMIFDGQGILSAEPRLVLVPSAFLFVTVLSFNLLGDALRSRWSAV
ncbi:MAG: peptide/nickel transport system permease protein [Solirubrobacteraceae bacterium]